MDETKKQWKNTLLTYIHTHPSTIIVDVKVDVISGFVRYYMSNGDILENMTSSEKVKAAIAGTIGQ